VCHEHGAVLHAGRDSHRPTSGSATAFYLDHSGASTIKGFAIGTDNGMDVDAGIQIVSGSGHHIACNHIGLDAAGSGALGSSVPDVRVLVEGNASDVIIGTNGDGVDDLGERNVIGYGGCSVYINGNHNNTIAGNYIGFSADGATQVGAGLIQIRQYSSNDLIGSDGDGISDELERNYFGSNKAFCYRDGSVPIATTPSLATRRARPRRCRRTRDSGD